MIARITDAAALAAVEQADCWYGRKITAYARAYGVGYDFCQFFAITAEDKLCGWAMLLNATLVLCAVAPLPSEELSCFITLHAPERVEGSHLALDNLVPDGYGGMNRTLFTLCPIAISPAFAVSEIDEAPSLQQVYEILQEGFPHLMERSLWMTDTSHMMRHGAARLFTYRGMTTASMQFDVNDHVLVGQVATRIAARGSGYARSFLGWLAARLAAEGKTAVLYALDIRVSFYTEIGFIPTETSCVLHRLDTAQEPTQKGNLN